MTRTLTLIFALLLFVVPMMGAFAEMRKPFEPEMVRIPGGTFDMGCVIGKDCEPDEKPAHRVTIKAFEIGKYEVTNAQFVAFLNVIGRRGPKSGPWFQTKAEDSSSQITGSVGNFKVETGKENFPVVNVSWFDAQAYAEWLSGETGKHYRLPTEAEWEYAARAKSTSKYWWGNEASREYANYGKDKCCGGFGALAKGADRWVQTAPVGSFPRNGFGIHDMHGNVREWVEDCWHNNYKHAPTNGSAWLDGGICRWRVLRGGSWLNVPSVLRSAYRYWNDSNYRVIIVGFRIARTFE